MRAIHRLTIVSLLAVGVSLAAQGKAIWDDLYREAIKHVQRKEWKLAEEKLMESKKTGPASGRGVIRRGLLGRDDYFPDFYLGVVFVNTGRPGLAIPQFQSARKAGLNPRDSEFRQIDQFEATAAALLKAEADLAESKRPDPKIAQFNKQLDEAQTLFKENRFDEAEAIAKKARAFNVDNAAVDALLQNIGRARLTARLQQQLKASPGLPELRKLLSEYENTGISVEEIRRRIAAAEGAISAARLAVERNGMIEFFSGNYQKALGVFAEAEKSAPLSARSNFYRACTLASLATRGKATNQSQLREARKYYAAAAAENAAAFSRDLRYISPRILELLK
jgi:tetratricopeptide (TPR) repeat protein